jgi:glycylpeptide N-tetradecanoyltransferase
VCDDRLIFEALIHAYNEGFDVFNCLTVMDNDSFLNSLKFKEGNGNLHYYLYNYYIKTLNSSEVGIVLV